MDLRSAGTSASRMPAKKQRKSCQSSSHRRRWTDAPCTRAQYEGSQQSYLLVRREGGWGWGWGDGRNSSRLAQARRGGRPAMPPTLFHRPSPPRRHGPSSAPASSPCSGAVDNVCAPKFWARRPNPGARRGSALGSGSEGGKRPPLSCSSFA